MFPLNSATIAAEVERGRDHALPDRQADTWHAVTRLLSAVRERQAVRDRRRRAAILVRLPVPGR